MIFVRDDDGRKLYPAPVGNGELRLQLSKVGVIVFYSRVEAEIFIAGLAPRVNDAEIEEIPYTPQ